MHPSYQPIGECLARVRGRWRALGLLRATIRAALAASAVLLAAFIAAQGIGRSPLALAGVFAASFVLVLGAFIWSFARLGAVPSDQRLARFIEERVPALDDRLATAVHLAADARLQSSETAGRMLADAASRVSEIDLDDVLPVGALRRTGLRAAGTALLLMAAAFIASGPARESLDAASLVLFPSRAALEVKPGDARVVAGTRVAIEARLVGNRAPVAAEVQIGEDGQWRSAGMTRDGSGTFRLALDSVTTPFTYRVVAGGVISPTFAVTVARPPRVTRVDLDYVYPPGLGLQPRAERDSGDIYAPAGTEVGVRVHTDRPVASGRMALDDGKALALTPESPTLWSTTFRVVEDGSYRVGLVDHEGLANVGETEYFIRVREDRPPEVHITRPAGDRAVTRLEEVDVEAQADDDYGIARLELVYAVRGKAEKAIPLEVPARATTVTARRTLYLEDFDIQPGDFVSYYVRARDRTRGGRPNEARSDMFFLDVRPYEQEFSLSQSQSMSGSGYSGAIDDLVNAQRQVVVATWKLDRRTGSAKGARSERDIRSVAETESALRARVEQTASTFRESTMRDPRRRGPNGSSAGQARPEEDAMAAAADAMENAVTALEALSTGRALPPEMEALNLLLKAQAEVKRRQLSLNQSAGPSGNSNRNYDISTLFDRELRRQQQTSYETTKGPERRQDPESEALDKIRDLARRQDELLRQQRELARARMPPEERIRQLEQLTRDQSELRERAEDLTRQMSERSNQPQPRTPPGRNTRSAPSLEQGQTGSPGGDSGNRQKMRDVSEAMRQAAGDLRRGAPDQAGANASRALEQLRDLEKRLQASQPDDRKRALGDLRLEARQLADRQRQVAAETARRDAGAQDPLSMAGKDATRRLAGEQDRLAERARRLQESLKTLDAASRDAAGLSERMQRAADDLRSGKRAGGEQEEIARRLDRLGDRLGAAAGDGTDESRKLSEQLARAQALRDAIEQTARALEGAGRQSGPTGDNGSQKAPGERGQTGQGRRGAGGTDLNELRRESLRQMQEASSLVDDLRRDDPSFSKNGAGFTFEGQGLVMSAPGTEAFKQDFAKWDALTRQAMAALEQVESTLSTKLQANAARDRLAGGVEDKAPPRYRKQVDSYFKALTAKRK